MGVGKTMYQCTRCGEEFEGEPLWVKPALVKKWFAHCKSCADKAAECAPRVSKAVLKAFWRRIMAEREAEDKRKAKDKSSLAPDLENLHLSGGLFDYVDFEENGRMKNE